MRFITKISLVLASVAVLTGSTLAIIQPQPVYASPVPAATQVKAECKDDTLDKNNCGIVGLLVTFINILAGLVGGIVVIMIIVGGIQYSTAGDDPQKVQGAKKKISNALLALFTFIFMFAFLQWVVPGGLF